MAPKKTPTTKKATGKKTPAKPQKPGKADVSPKKNARKQPVKGKASSSKGNVSAKKPARKINCQLPGAELLEQGKSVDEVMAALASDLEPRQERFCQEYVSCGVAVRAYLRAYPDSSYDAACSSSSDLLRNPKILQRVEQLTEEHKERYGLTEAKVLKRLAALAMFDRRGLHKEDGSLKQIHELTEEEAAAITEIESVELFEGKGEQRSAIGIVRKVKFSDPKGAIELAGRNLKLWKDPGSKENPITVARIELVPLG